MATSDDPGEAALARARSNIQWLESLSLTVGVIKDEEDEP